MSSFSPHEERKQIEFDVFDGMNEPYLCNKVSTENWKNQSSCLGIR